MYRKIVVLMCFWSLMAGALRAAPARQVVTFWHAMRGAKGQAVHRLVARFNEENPDVDVQEKFIGSDNQRFGNDYHALYQAVLEQLARHRPPDVVQVYENWTTQLIEVGAVVPIQKFLTADDHVDDLVPVFRQANTFNGTLYTLPFNKSVYLLYYNPSLVPQPPRTLAELRETARQVVQQHPGVAGLTFQPGVDIFGDFLYACGGQFFESDVRAGFSELPGVQALQILDDMTKARTATPSLGAQQLFTSGQAAMYIYSSTAQVDMRTAAHFEIGVSPVPMAGTVRSYQFAGTNLALLAPPGRQAAAARLIRFLARLDSTVEFAKATGYLPVRTSALQDKTYLAFLQQNPGFKVGLDCLPYAHIQPRLSAWESIRGILDDAVFATIEGKGDPRSSLVRAAQQAEELIRHLNGQ